MKTLKVGGAVSAVIGVSAAMAIGVACGSGRYSGVGGDGSEAGTPDNEAGDDGGGLIDTGLGDTTPPVPPVSCSEVPDASKGAFVSTIGGRNSGPCTPDKPCGTLDDGITWAKANARTIVYVDQGTYVEQLKLVPGITIQGGWQRDAKVGWTRICDDLKRANSVFVQAPRGASITAIADDLGGDAVLDTINLHSKNAPAAEGESLYGLVVRGTSSKVKLIGVGIAVAGAGAGAPGGSAPAGTSGAPTCATAGNGGTPGAGGSGDGAQAGAFDRDLYHPSSGKRGDVGGTGGNGASAKGTCNSTSCVDTCTGGPTTPCIPDPNGTVSAPGTLCGNDGQPGCGGGGGPGGDPGAGGGSSVGLYVWDGTAEVTFGLIAAGPGGNGGAGGPGGAGGAGGSGAPGASNTSPCKCQKVGTTCQSMSATFAGGPAGPAGAGSAGGIGGGGAGGSSYAYYKGGGATITESNTILEHGVRGEGGNAPGGKGGAPGVAADHN